MIVYRHADPRHPFLWEDAGQPSARWHGLGEGPVHYFADTPNGAWAEFLRHEEIHDPADLAGVRRALWAIEIPRKPHSRPRLPHKILSGGPETYTECQEEAARLRLQGKEGFRAPSAALRPGGAGGWIVDGGIREAGTRAGEVIVLFGRRPDLVGWPITLAGSPPEELLERVRYLYREQGRE